MNNMEEDNFKKSIKEFRNIHLANTEKANMLKNILSTPIKSPFRVSRFAYTLSMLLVISFGSAIYASETSLPGDILYPIKTRLVEPLLDVAYSAPEEKIVWEEIKVERRIAEAENLVKKDKLDEKKLKELEKKIEKSSKAFTRAVEIVASSTATSTNAREENVKNRKEEFRKKINKQNKEEKKEKIKRLRDTATKFLNDKNEDLDKSFD